jgi:tetratricopeptide (TPR) repeat protein
LYRLGKLDELRVEAPPEISLETLWEQTSTTWLHKTAHELVRQDQLDRLHQFQSDPLVKDLLRPALRELLLARDACPILAKVHLRLARLSVLVGHPSADRVHLERACSTGPSSTYTLTRAGRLHAQAGRLEAACRNWQASLTLNPSALDVVLPWSKQAMTDAIFVEHVLPTIPESLIDLTTSRFGTAEHEELRNLLLDRASRLLDEADLPADQQAYLRGRILGLRQRLAEAVESYAVALQIQPTQLAWRYEMALLLEKQGRLNEAHEQAVRCVAMEPDNAAYDELLKRIIRAKLRPGEIGSDVQIQGRRP